MADSGKSTLQMIIRGCSRLLLLVGAVVFFFGDRFLREIEHVNVLASEAIGILGGVLLMVLGAGIKILDKSPKPEQHND
jgi:hypothetical protein